MNSIARSVAAALIVSAALCAGAGAQTINAKTDIRWPTVTGAGAPTMTCASTNYGQPYTDTTNNHQYTCTSSGWLQVDGGGSAGVTQIIPGTNVTISPSGGTGAVTINAAGGVSAPASPNLLKLGPPTLLPYFDPQPAGLIDVTDTFASVSTFTQQAGSGSATMTVSGNVGTVATTGSSFGNFLETSDATLLAPQFFNSVEVTGITASTGYTNTAVGACLDTTHWAVAYYDAVNHAIHINYQYPTNSDTNVLSVTLATPFWIALSMDDTSLVAWYKTSANANWTYAGAVNSAYDYTATSNFASAGYKTCIQYSTGGNASISFANLAGGRRGGVSMRDIKAVVNTDGTTYQPGSNLIYFTATTNDPAEAVSGSSERGASQGVFTLNLNTQAITQTGVICTSRSSHTYCDDSAGEIVYHSGGDREMVWSSWSNGFSNTTPVGVLYKYVTSGSQGDLLSTNLSVMGSPTTITLPLGTSGKGAYDAALAYDGANSRYLLAYTICNDCTFPSTASSNYFPALAYASAPTGTWSSIGIDSTLQGNWEGTNLVNWSGAFYELAAGPHNPVSSAWSACTRSRIYDASLTLAGALRGATLGNSSASANFPCPHPGLFAFPDGITWGVLTFNSTPFVSATGLTAGQPVLEISTP